MLVVACCSLILPACCQSNHHCHRQGRGYQGFHRSRGPEGGQECHRRSYRRQWRRGSPLRRRRHRVRQNRRSRDGREYHHCRRRDPGYREYHPERVNTRVSRKVGFLKDMRDK